MSHPNNDSNECEEKSVKFYNPSDLLGNPISPITETPTDKKIDNSLPFSDYQSVKHFCLLSMASLGLYPFFWFFKHWQYLREEKNINISPSFRTAFTLFYGYSLFKEFEVLAKDKGYHNRQPLFILFMCYLLLAITPALTGSLLPLFSFFAFIPLIPVLRMINFYYLKEQKEYPIKMKFSRGEKWFMASVWIFMFAFVLFNLILR